MLKLWIDLLKLFYPTIDEADKTEVIAVSVGLVVVVVIVFIFIGRA